MVKYTNSAIFLLLAVFVMAIIASQSVEKTAKVTLPETNIPEELQELVILPITVEVDDFGFYKDGAEITTLEVPQNTYIELSVSVKSSGLAKSGLDIASPRFDKLYVQGGQQHVFEFDSIGDFTITAYWPGTSIEKAKLDVVAT